MLAARPDLRLIDRILWLLPALVVIVLTIVWVRRARRRARHGRRPAA
jgi:cytochrome c-type biogenesis protein CcmH/NrfF